jgi:two-component system copper resistance phosphate regulon response regulator CusR
MRILLAEDDGSLRDVLERGLREHSFAVDAVSDGREALLKASTRSYDAMILDIVMPLRSGLEVCTELRAAGSHVPIVLLTARDTVDDRIIGLDAGADDYVVKPFAFGELLARIRAVMRRRAELLPSVIHVADLEVDTRRQTVTRSGRPISLTAKEYAFLEFLARNAGAVISRMELSAHVWDGNHDPVSNLLDVYVSRLRRKIDGGQSRRLLHIRRGSGIMLGTMDEPPGGDDQSSP